jgi:hypothetical protein
VKLLELGTVLWKRMGLGAIVQQPQCVTLTKTAVVMPSGRKLSRKLVLCIKSKVLETTVSH